MPINLAIIGLSGREPPSWSSIAHLKPLRSPALSSYYELNALCTSTSSSAAMAAEKYGIAKGKAYSDVHELAQDPEVGMVVISVKVPLHKELTLPILDAGKDVLVEWPLAKNLAEADELTALADKVGVRTMVGLQGRQVAAVKKAKEIIASGVLGPVVATSLIAQHASLDLPEKADYYNDYTNGSNFITNRCGHTLDTMCHTLGEFTSLQATAGIRFPTMNLLGMNGNVIRSVQRHTADYLTVQGTLQGGASASVHIYASTAESMSPMPLLWSITGEKGTLKMEGSNGMIQLAPPRMFLCLASQSNWEEIELPEQMAVGGVGEAYLAFAKGEQVPNFKAAVLRHRMLEAVMKSANQGTREGYEIDA